MLVPIDEHSNRSVFAEAPITTAAIRAAANDRTSSLYPLDLAVSTNKRHVASAAKPPFSALAVPTNDVDDVHSTTASLVAPTCDEEECHPYTAGLLSVPAGVEITTAPVTDPNARMHRYELSVADAHLIPSTGPAIIGGRSGPPPTRSARAVNNLEDFKPNDVLSLVRSGRVSRARIVHSRFNIRNPTVVHMLNEIEAALNSEMPQDDEE